MKAKTLWCFAAIGGLVYLSRRSTSVGGLGTLLQTLLNRTTSPLLAPAPAPAPVPTAAPTSPLLLRSPLLTLLRPRPVPLPAATPVVPLLPQYIKESPNQADAWGRLPGDASYGSLVAPPGSDEASAIPWGATTPAPIALDPPKTSAAPLVIGAGITAATALFLLKR